MQIPSEFRPEVFSRRGEWTAWGLTLAAGAAWGALALNGLAAPLVIKLVGAFCLISGVAISLTNWMERRTLLRLEADGVRFSNGLRQVWLPWEDIQQVQVFPSNMGDQVRVSGSRTFFTFRTYGEARMGNQVRARMGFAQGDAIRAYIQQRIK